jgi:hypothetical protein
MRFTPKQVYHEECSNAEIRTRDRIVFRSSRALTKRLLKNAIRLWACSWRLFQTLFPVAVNVGLNLIGAFAQPFHL